VTAHVASYASEVEERAHSVLTDAWTDVLAAVAARRSLTTIDIGPPLTQSTVELGPDLAAPVDGMVEIAPAFEDDVRPPQRYPAVRVAVVDSDEVYGVNAGAGRALHTLEVRTLVRVSSRAGTIGATKGWSASTASLICGLTHRMAVYLLQAGLTDDTTGIYNVESTSGGSRDLVQGDDVTIYRATSTLGVWQRTRSGRFDHPVTDS